MKKPNLAIIAMLLVFISVFAPLCGAAEVKSVDVLTISTKTGDTIDGYIRKNFPDISAKRDASWFTDACSVFTDLAGIENSRKIKTGMTINLSRDSFCNKMLELERMSLPGFRPISNVVQKATIPVIKTRAELIETGLVSSLEKTEEPIEDTSALIDAEAVSSLEKTEEPTENNFRDYSRNNLFEVKAVGKHIVKKGETISHIAYRHFKKSGPGFWRAFADFNGIKNMHRLKVGQVLLIPNVVIREQAQVGFNPTTVEPERAVEMMLQQTNRSAKEAGIEVVIDESGSKRIATEIANSKKVRVLNKRLLAATTFATGVQGWTKVTAKAELSGPSISQRSGKYIVNMTIATQCKNAASDIEKRLAMLPPLPEAEMMPTFTRPLPDGKIRKIEATIPFRTVCENCVELNNVDGAFHDEPVTGGKTDGWWTSTEYWFDCHGRWTNGIGFLSQNWSGKSGDADPYRYSGGVLMPSIMTRYTDEHWQLVGRYAAGERKDRGGFENEWVSYSANGESDITDYYVSLERRDLDRRWFSKNRLSVQVQQSDENTQKTHNQMFSKWDGSNIPLKGIKPEDQDTMSATLTSDVYSFDNLRNYLVVTQVGLGHQDNYDNNSFSLQGGIQLFGGLKFLTGYTWNSAKPVADTKNIINFELYPYGLYLGLTKKSEPGKPKVREADTEVTSMEKRLERMKQYNKQ